MRSKTKYYEQSLRDLGTLEIKDGKIVASKENLFQNQCYNPKTVKPAAGKEYVEAIKTFAKEIGEQAKINNKILEKTVGNT